MSIKPYIKDSLKAELNNAQSIWVATAMITDNGWKFIQSNIPKGTRQHFLIGIDLSTSPSVFENIYADKSISARVYQTKHTFHPKVYLIQRKDGSLTAFVGSSNTTNWGLEKNIEMNFQIKDEKECNNLRNWFDELYQKGFLITESFINDYNEKYKKVASRQKEIDADVSNFNLSLVTGEGQFFNANQHEVFREEYHRIDTDDVRTIRKGVREKLLVLHRFIYPQFSKYGLTDLHCHYQSREIVSRHFFNKFSGNYVNSMWLHYGKSENQLKLYHNPKDKSINKPDSFINNIRIQIIVRAKEIGVWLVLGRNNGSKFDRKHFREHMGDPAARKAFFELLRGLDKDYWIDSTSSIKISDIKKPDDVIKFASAAMDMEYFIIGKSIPLMDSRLSKESIGKTVLGEFKKLYPLYEMMRHK